MRPYSLDLRERVAAAVDHYEGSIRWIARVFRVSTCFIVRLLQRRRATGTLAPGPPALGSGDLGRLAGLVREQPDATLEQLRRRGGFRCSLKTLWFALNRLGLTRKKKSLHATQRDRPDVQEEAPPVPAGGAADRAKEAGLRGRDRGHHGDDPGLRPGAARRAGGWLRPGLVGDGHRDRGPGAGRCPRPAGVPGVDRHGSVPDVRGAGAGAGTAQGRSGGLRQPQAAPERRCGGVDRGRRARVLPLPPYSPDYTPIEEMFSKVKQGLRRAGARARAELYDALGEVLRRVTPEDILGWFRHAGLCATHG